MDGPWRPIDVTDAHLTCAWQQGDAIVIVGYAGTVLWRRGDRWELEAAPTLEHLFGVWATAPDHVFACGATGTILSHDGATWTQESTGFKGALHGISGAGDFVVAVGAGGAIFQR